MRGRKAEAFVRILMLITGWVLIVIFGTQFTAEAVLRNAMVNDLVAAIMIKGFLLPLIAAAGAQTGMEVSALKKGKTAFSHHALILFTGLPVFIIGGMLIFSSMMAFFLPFTWYGLLQR